MLSILFVDDEPAVLETLALASSEMKDQWETCLSGGGKDALSRMETSKFDVVVSDMDMPEMDGAEFLDRAQDLQPDAIRIVLASEKDLDMAARSARSAHRFLIKPCDPLELSATINQTMDIRTRVSNPALHSAAAAVSPLPALPKLYNELVELLRAKETNMADVAKLVSYDISMSGAVLQLSNSSLFCMPTKIESIEKATVMLGVDVIKNMVLAHEVFNAFDVKGVAETFNKLWDESMAISAIARKIAPLISPHDYVKDQAMTSAILQNLGMVIRATTLKKKYINMLEAADGNTEMLCRLEKGEFGFSHEELASYVLSLWGLPDFIVEAVYHSRANQLFSTNMPLNCLVVANAIYAFVKSGTEIPKRLQTDMKFFDLDVSQIKKTGEFVLADL